jgi:mRNA interferase RelE/StbE
VGMMYYICTGGKIQVKALLSRIARKQFANINEPEKSLIVEAITKLEKNPPEGDIKKLKGRDGFRVRKGNYRIIFKIRNGTITIDEIITRGQAYK